MNLKQKKYSRLYNQLKELLLKDTCLLSQLATINAILYHKNPSFFWVGFYLLKNNKLLVGPYQGPVACQELEFNKGVCWAGIIKKQCILVDNVDDFPGHIACDSRSKSELVLPLFNSKKEVIGVLDIDSDKKAYFDEFDTEGLREILTLIHPDFLDNHSK
jgi:GAF domain-containing protein